MKYKELLNFEPITEVVKFSRTSEAAYQKNLVSTFVFSDTFKDILIPLMVKNLDFNYSGESFGIQVVGNYGTGKSHLMSLVSLIAENPDLLNLVKEEKPKKSLQAIAGKFKVLRFELGNSESLWEVITYKIENYLKEIGVDFSFEGHGPKTYFEKLQLMMSEFEEKFPGKGFLIVIDEMLAYLKGRASDKLNTDLAVLQHLGQACDSSRFKFIFGVQELIYRSTEFQFAAKMLQQVSDRYKDITIHKEDVAFIVKKRLLSKDEHQKQKIKEHLEPYLALFTDLHARTQEYVELFPVHPSYFENFEKIRIGKSQREILKTLSNQFQNILEQDIPKDNPGLLTYDSYWEHMKGESDLMADPDIRRIKEVTDTVSDKIDTFFTGGRAANKVVANRIANACAIKILQQELTKQHGTNAENLVDDLCLTNPIALMEKDRQLLVDTIESAAGNIITASSGQFFDKNNENGEYHLRIEGGINFDQKIKDYADQMPESNKDDYFFKFLGVNLPLDVDSTYRTGFKIWSHPIEWKSHKTFRDGYIFFGNPNEKSTTQPRQHFYMYFMPIFDESKKIRNHEEDEVYFIFDDLSEEFKKAVTLYGAALALAGHADSSQKTIYNQKISELNKKARNLFDQEYVQITKVDYMGKELPLGGFQLPGAGSIKEQVFSDVASDVFEPWFNNENPDYPSFSQLLTPVTKDNFHTLIKKALTKVANPEQANKDGEGVLSGLGCYVPGMLDISHSQYAKNVVKQLKDKGDGKVLNKDEIITYVEHSDNVWLSNDYKIEAELEFTVLATLAALGEIEITLSSGQSLNASNLIELRNLDRDDFFSFTHVKPPKGLNEAALKEMFVTLLGRDLSKQLKDPNTYTSLVTAAEDWAKRAVSLLSKIQGGYMERGITLVTVEEASHYRQKFSAFSGFCDKLASYTTEAKMKNFQFTVEQIKGVFEAKPLIEKVEAKLKEFADFTEDVSYLNQAKQYLSDYAFKEEINKAIGQLESLLESDDSAKKVKYKSDLKRLRNKYADWYFEIYLKHRISDTDNTQKFALQDSEEKAICDILKDADFLSTGQYHQWFNQLNKLQPADPAVNKEAVLATPYHDFNPLDFEDGDEIYVSDLQKELKSLLENWTTTLLNSMEDPMVKKNMSLLKANQVALLKSFQNGDTKLVKENALAIKNAIMELHKGMSKVELTMDSLKETFNKPLTPDEAIETFKKYVDSISQGKERDTIRIILK
jgi:RNAse (barnase) inhibitor barstar